MSRPYSPRSSASANLFVRVNGKIRAREVRVIGVDGQQIGVLPLGDAITLARTHSVDLVEIAPNATPPVCRLVDFGKYRYEQAKRDKEAKKHHHANKVKEIQLSATIDPHDFGVKLQRAIDFLCEDMKVKITLRFRGREMTHQEFGFQVVEKFIQTIAPFGHPDAVPKLVGKGLNVMLSPLPRGKRAKNPRETEGEPGAIVLMVPEDLHELPPVRKPAVVPPLAPPNAKAAPTSAFDKGAPVLNAPFAQLDIPVRE